MSQGKQVHKRIFAALAKEKKGMHVIIFFHLQSVSHFLNIWAGMHSVTHTPVSTMLFFLKVQICLVSIKVTTTYNHTASKLK